MLDISLRFKSRLDLYQAFFQHVEEEQPWKRPPPRTFIHPEVVRKEEEDHLSCGSIFLLKKLEDIKYCRVPRSFAEACLCHRGTSW